jgi:hypothetical protein
LLWVALSWNLRVLALQQSSGGQGAGGVSTQIKTLAGQSLMPSAGHGPQPLESTSKLDPSGQTQRTGATALCSYSTPSSQSCAGSSGLDDAQPESMRKKAQNNDVVLIFIFSPKLLFCLAAAQSRFKPLLSNRL